MTPAWSRPRIAAAAALLLVAARAATGAPPGVLLRGEGLQESAPHGHGNIYAPEVHRDGQRWRMWYGGQGRDGHDRILHAESDDGLRWTRRGVAIDCGAHNHVNDPTVVRAGGRWWMFYTVAPRAEEDAIAAATSDDGLRWTLHGIVVPPGGGDAWDSGKVGRPSVLHEDGRFRLWYDGQPAPGASDRDPMAARVRSGGGRAVGYAESRDGLRWTRHPAPVHFGGAGAVQVVRLDGGYVLVHESHGGTRWSQGPDGITWTPRGLLLGLSGGPDDRHGQVTPFLLRLPGDNGLRLYFGAASAPTWDHNAIAAADLELPVQPVARP